MRRLFQQKQSATKGGGMRRSLLTVGVALGIIAAWSIGRLQGQAESGKVIFADPSHAKFSEMQGGNGGVSTAPLWGDANTGAHATFIKFVPGYEAGTHTHTNDVWIVVIKGAYLYKDEAGEKRVGPGDFLRVPGGHKHWSGGDKKEGALFYEEGSGKFDLIPAK
jgi:quercetin dioxygenase-like cupin family protein